MWCDLLICRDFLHAPRRGNVHKLLRDSVFHALHKHRLNRLHDFLSRPRRWEIHQWNKVEFSWLAHSLDPDGVSVSPRSNLSWAKYDSLAQADHYRVASSFSELYFFSRLTRTCAISLVVCLLFVFALHPVFFDDEWCVSCVNFGVQELSSLICHSEHTVQRQKTFLIKIFESQCPHVFLLSIFDLSSESM